MLAFKNIDILSDSGWVLGACIEIEDGLIKDIHSSTTPSCAIDLCGLQLIPGLIDLHGDMIEREALPRPGSPINVETALFELDKRLASSGITTAFSAISFAWGQDDTIRSEASATRFIESITTHRQELLVDHFIHSRFAITNPSAGAVLSKLLEENKVHLVSLMDHTPGQGQYRDIEAYVQFSISWAKRTEGIDLSRQQVMERIRAAQEKPKAYDVVRSLSEVARRKGVPLASHDDDTLEKVEFMVNMGVTMSEFPVTLEAAKAARQHGLATIMGAPNALRGISHSGNLSAREAIIHGHLDILATDYYPPSMLLSAFKLEEEGILPIHESINLICRNPARAVGLLDRGTLKQGFRADLVFIEKGNRPRVRATLKEGMPIYADNVFLDKCGGKLIQGRPLNGAVSSIVS